MSATTTSMSHTQRLRGPIEAALPELAVASSAVIMHPQFQDLCAEFLITVHQMIRASVPLMRTALARCQELAGRDPLAAAMVPYFTHHIREEMHHDDWLLEDLEVIGVPRAQVLRRMPPSSVASMIGAHYYWIHHHHPVAKLGQIAVMEGYPPTMESIDLLVARSGYPRAAFRTFEKHCHLDTHHRDEFNEALDAMPLQDEHFEILQASALHTIRGAANIYRDLLQRAVAPRVQGSAEAARGKLMPLRRPELMTERMGDDGSYRVEDTTSGAVYQIGQEEYFLLAHCDGGKSVEAVRDAFARRFGQPITDIELNDFLQMADQESLVTSAAQPGGT